MKDKYEIGLDARMIGHTGIGTYLQGLLGGWREENVLGGLDLCLFGAKDRLTPYGLPVLPFGAPIYSVREQAEYPFKLRSCRLWHAAHYNIPLLGGKTRLVVTVHDLIHWIFRREYFSPVQAFYAGAMFRRVVKRADHIITVSENTQLDLVKHFDAEPDKISVIYEAVDLSRFHPPKNRSENEAVLKRYGIDGPYFLFVGSLKPHKNVLWLIRLFRRLRQDGRVRALLVIAGRKDKKYRPDFRELEELNTGEGIIHLTSASDSDLTALYQGALALVHPSRYEGFGLTILEAMACGTPVIATRCGSVPEVAGDAACLVDSCSDHGMMQAITDMEEAPELRAFYAEKGREQAGKYCWRKAALQTAGVYERVLSQK